MHKVPISKRKYICKDCKNPISYMTGYYGLGYCKKCASKGKRAYNYKNGIWCSNRINLCLDCNKKIHPTAKRCSSCARKYELHPNWRGGKSFEPYPKNWTKTLKKSIRERDNYQCQLCGLSQDVNEKLFSDMSLCIHHIDYNKENLNPVNLISLCCVCHGKTNMNREYWTNYFNAKINQVPAYC